MGRRNEGGVMSTTPRPDAVNPTPRRRWRRLLLPALGLMSLVAALSWYGHFCNQAEGALARAVADVDAVDPHWRLEDVEASRAVVPDEQNGALLVLSAAGKLPPQWSAPLSEDLANEQYYARRPVEQLTESMTAHLRKMLEQVQPALADARRLVNRPSGRFPLTYAPDWAGTVTGHHDAVLSATDHLRYDVMLRAQDRDINGALASCRALANGGRSLGDEPIDGSQKIRMSLVLSAVWSAEMALGQGEAGDRELAALQQLLEDEEGHPGLEITLRGSRAGFHVMLRGIESGQFAVSSCMLWRKPIPVVTQVMDRWECDRMKFDHAQFLTDITDRIRQARTPWEQRPEASQSPVGLLICGNVTIRELLNDACTMPEGYCHYAAAQIRCGVALLAAERFRLAHGRWPESTAELAPGLADRPPTAPYLGGPLGLRRTAEGIIIYSKGLNGTDDGGDIDTTEDGPPMKDVGFHLWDVNLRHQPAPPPRPKKDLEGK